MESYKTIYKGGFAGFMEKKSRFIASIMPVKTEEEAQQFIERIKKKYWDASHNCSAYVLGRDNAVMRFSDDGEPARSAGWPMLNLLLQEGIHDAAAVVTRYFGGILLGTGGLVRAYTETLREGLRNSVIIEKKPAALYLAVMDYNVYGKLRYIADSMYIKITKTQFTDVVEAEFAVPEELIAVFTKKVLEAAGRDIVLTRGSDIFYSEIHGEIKLFQE